MDQVVIEAKWRSEAKWRKTWERMQRICKPSRQGRRGSQLILAILYALMVMMWKINSVRW